MPTWTPKKIRHLDIHQLLIPFTRNPGLGSKVKVPFFDESLKFPSFIGISPFLRGEVSFLHTKSHCRFHTHAMHFHRPLNHGEVGLAVEPTIGQIMTCTSIHLAFSRPAVPRAEETMNFLAGITEDC
jgi:hypothetical protein